MTARRYAEYDLDDTQPDLDSTRDAEYERGWAKYLETVEGRWEVFSALFGYHDNAVSELLQAFKPYTMRQIYFLEETSRWFSEDAQSTRGGERHTKLLALMSATLTQFENGVVFPEPDEDIAGTDFFAAQPTPLEYLMWKVRWCEENGFAPEVFVGLHRTG